MTETDPKLAERRHEAPRPDPRPVKTDAPAPVPETPGFVRGPTYTGPDRRAP